MRLDKFLCDCGIGTRTEVKKLIKSGRVSVNGVAEKSANTKISEDTAEVRADGVLLVYRKFVYLMLNKPAGCISAVRDKLQPVVTDFIPEEYHHLSLFPVGRLDIDTVGLLILTNDGDLAHKLTSPAQHVPKTYIAKVEGRLDESHVNIFKREMDLGDFTAMPSELEIIKIDNTESTAKVTVCEGKFHQVKRMFKHVEHPVISLERVSVNQLPLDPALPRGKTKELTEDELELLKYGL